MTMSEQTPDAPHSSDLASFFKTVEASLNYSQNPTGSRAGDGSASLNPPPPGGPRPARPWRVRPSLLAALTGLVLFNWAPLFLPTREVTIPEACIGTWRTSVPSHAGRSFTLTGTSLVLKAGPGGSIVSTHPITRVRLRRLEGDMVLTLEYLVEEAPHKFAFRLSPGPTPVIRLVNQPAIRWVKDTHR
jgi:hypothetical protein